MNEIIRTEREIRPNTTILVEYTHIGPRPAPSHGAEWPVELDYPIVRVRFGIPGNQALRSDLIDLSREVFGEALHAGWGEEFETSGLWRFRSAQYSGPTVHIAYERCVELAEKNRLTLCELIDARNARMEERNKTIQASRIDSPFGHTD